MVNIEEFAERLKIVMDYYELSAALLAKKIEVQRSSISHILSGRNKPGLEFVLKILKTFPEVELDWLLNGLGKFPKQIENSLPTTPTSLSDKNNEENVQAKSRIEEVKGIAGEIEHIVVFYKNGTFRNYTP